MKLTYIATFICFLFVLGSCHKKENYQVYFFQNVNLETPYHLELDNEHKGQVPYLNKEGNCLDSAVQSNALVLQLREGSYKYKMLNSSDEVIAEGKFKISSQKVSSSGGKGSAMLQVGDHCASMRLGE